MRGAGRGRGGAHPPQGRPCPPESRIRSPARPGKPPPGFPAQARLLGLPPAPGPALPGTRTHLATQQAGLPLPLRLAQRPQPPPQLPSQRPLGLPQRRRRHLAALPRPLHAPSEPGRGVGLAPGAAAAVVQPGRAPGDGRGSAGRKVAALRAGRPPSPPGCSPPPRGGRRASLGTANPIFIFHVRRALQRISPFLILL